jgi:hypothetical protein
MNCVCGHRFESHLKWRDDERMCMVKVYDADGDVWFCDCNNFEEAGY